MLRSWCALAAVLLLPAAALAGPAYDDPAKTDDDFPVQGEYVGTATEGGQQQPVGFQVIARGKGKFDAVQYPGGLPGAGWKKEAGKRMFQGGREEGGIVLKCGNPKLEAVIQGDALSVKDSGGQVVATGKKTARQSETLGAKPPEGAVVLFDGKSAEAFQGGRLTPDGLLMQGVTSQRKFGSCTLHLEFRTPYQPEDGGQARGNSGCYLQGRYEVQILDSFGLEGKNNECGGIYSIKDPDVNMCLPPLAWQTYDIDYTAATYDAAGQKTANARITVRHNGVVIHKDVELPKATTAAPVKEGPENGPLYLQDHGNPVRFRNIWLVEKK